jgi:hypothetical protein
MRMCLRCYNPMKNSPLTFLGTTHHESRQRNATVRITQPHNKNIFTFYSKFSPIHLNPSLLRASLTSYKNISLNK